MPGLVSTVQPVPSYPVPGPPKVELDKMSPELVRFSATVVVVVVDSGVVTVVTTVVVHTVVMSPVSGLFEVSTQVTVVAVVVSACTSV